VGRLGGSVVVGGLPGIAIFESGQCGGGLVVEDVATVAQPGAQGDGREHGEAQGDAKDRDAQMPAVVDDGLRAADGRLDDRGGQIASQRPVRLQLVAGERSAEHLEDGDAELASGFAVVVVVELQSIAVDVSDGEVLVKMFAQLGGAAERACAAVAQQFAGVIEHGVAQEHLVVLTDPRVGDGGRCAVGDDLDDLSRLPGGLCEAMAHHVTEDGEHDDAQQGGRDDAGATLGRPASDHLGFTGFQEVLDLEQDLPLLQESGVSLLIGLGGCAGLLEALGPLAQQLMVAVESGLSVGELRLDLAGFGVVVVAGGLGLGLPFSGSALEGLLPVLKLLLLGGQLLLRGFDGLMILDELRFELSFSLVELGLALLEGGVGAALLLLAGLLEFLTLLIERSALFAELGPELLQLVASLGQLVLLLLDLFLALGHFPLMLLVEFDGLLGRLFAGLLDLAPLSLKFGALRFVLLLLLLDGALQLGE